MRKINPVIFITIVSTLPLYLYHKHIGIGITLHWEYSVIKFNIYTLRKITATHNCCTRFYKLYETINFPIENKLRKIFRQFSYVSDYRMNLISKNKRY